MVEKYLILIKHIKQAISVSEYSEIPRYWSGSPPKSISSPQEVDQANSKLDSKIDSAKFTNQTHIQHRPALHWRCACCLFLSLIWTLLFGRLWEIMASHKFRPLPAYCPSLSCGSCYVDPHTARHWPINHRFDRCLRNTQRRVFMRITD